MNTNRAGRYVSQPTGYQAFMPEPLPPNPSIAIEGEMQALLSQADRVLGRLDGSIVVLPNPELFMYMFIRKEAVLSSQIEGTQSSLHDVLAAEAKIFSPVDPQDTGEVINYIRATHLGLNELLTLPLSMRLIKKIHAELLQGVRGAKLMPGEVRSSQNWIGSGGCTLNEATFVPPPPHEVPRLLSEVEQFIHLDTSMPLLLKIGMIHSQFETIHPFLDGNGRLGRLLITFLLCQQEVLTKPVLYISLYFKKHQQRYYDLLQAVRDEGAWEEWLLFFLQGIIEVSKQATETARKILFLREEHRNLIAEHLRSSAGKGHQVLEYLYGHPYLGVNQVQELLDSSYQSANELVAKLAKIGILKEITGNVRNRVFSYESYIALFED